MFYCLSDCFIIVLCEIIFETINNYDIVANWFSSITSLLIKLTLFPFPQILYSWMVDYRQEANMSVLQREGRLEEAFQESVGKTSPPLRTASRLDSIFNCLAAAYSVLRSRCELRSWPWIAVNRLDRSPDCNSCVFTFSALPFIFFNAENNVTSKNRNLMNY